MGHVVQTPAGTWRANWRDRDGRQRAKNLRTKREARAYLAQVEADLSRGSYVDPSAGRALFGPYAERWLEAKGGEEATVARDGSLMRNHVLPHWRSRPLGKIDHLSVQEWVVELGRGLAPATVRECHRLLAGVLKAAVRERLIPANPSDGVRLPSRRRRKRGVDSSDRVTIARADLTDRLLPALPHRHRAIVATAALAGLRWGECAGLRWSNVDLAAGVLSVSEVVVEVSGRVSRRPYPKTEAGVRVVPIPPDLAAELRRHRDEYGVGEDGAVFANERGGLLRRTGLRTRVWKPALATAGLPHRMRFHDLRHSYSTWLVSEGVPVNVVQYVMGHEEAATTLNIYTNVPPNFAALVLAPFADRR